MRTAVLGVLMGCIFAPAASAQLVVSANDGKETCRERLNRGLLGAYSQTWVQVIRPGMFHVKQGRGDK